MKAKFTIAALILCLIVCRSSAQPLVYDKENTGAHYPKPVFPSYDQLPGFQLLPDPFVFFDGSGRDASFGSWERRRNEIKAAIEKYEIGPKPDRSDLTITAAYAPGSPGTLTVDILRLSNGRTLRLTSTINLPSGTPPAAGWPAIIRMALAPGIGANSLGIATIDYVHDDVTQYAAGQQISHAGDPYFLMYPEYNAGPCPPSPAPCGQQVGQYSAWSWGVSRLIDGMEIAAKQLVNPLPIDIKHLGVNGCSYAGKMALFAGAFDERIAATFAQESGGGGAPAWRVSHAIEPEGTVEKTNNTDGSWFITSMKSDFGRDNVYKLPHDHHELQAMIAPRALFVSGNTDFTWLSNRSTYVTAKATQKIYEALGVGDRYGYWIDGNHGHCALGTGEQAAIDGFYKKFLLGQNVAWDVHVAPLTSAFTSIDHERWYQWWGRPTVTPAQSFTINDKVENNAAAGTVTATDPDANTTLQDWRIDGGTGAAMFSINASTGEITVSNKSLLDFENVQSYTLQVSVSDGDKRSEASIVTINLVHVPVITTGQVFEINEWVTDNYIVGIIKAIDKDASTVLGNWQITGGTGASVFAVNTATGEIRSTNSSALNFSNTSSYTLILTVSDGSNTSSQETVTIKVSDKVYVCHFGKSMYVQRSKVPDHIKHGDYTGSCINAVSETRMATTSEADATTGNNKIQIYPNPSKGVINVNLGTNQQNIRTVQVIDLSGRVVMQLNVGKMQSLSIPGGKLKAGTYLIKMLGDKPNTQKIVVQ